MNNYTLDPSALRFPILTTERYLACLERAKQSIRERVQPPEFQSFKAATVSEYPRWFFGAILVALILVLLFSFTISAGKQAAAAGMLFDHLPAKFTRLSELWATLSVAFMLLLSEIGAVLFLVGAGTLAHTAPAVTLRGQQFNLTAWVFRLFAFLCAGYAILANVTITALDPEPRAAVLQWAISIGVPSIVLGLGIMLERLLTDTLKSRSERKTRYERALLAYQSVQADPTSHTSWFAVLADQMWTEMVRFKKDKTLLEPLVEADANNKRLLLAAEYQAQQAAGQINLGQELALPFLSGPANG